MIDQKWGKPLFFILLALAISPYTSTAHALIMGIVYSLFFGLPFTNISKINKKLLQYSIVGLGFGINLSAAIETTGSSFFIIVASIITTFIVGYLLGRVFKIHDHIAKLITVGTAICGGSAIATVAPVLDAEDDHISISLGIVFALNAIALIIFPSIGQWLEMDQHTFGMWSAIAIHDTSSVVGAASAYGVEALQVATTVKLTRALWIIPIAFVFALLSKKEGSKIKFPMFILFFIGAILLNSFVPMVHDFAPYITKIARTALKVSLFIIGMGLSIQNLKKVGLKPLVFAVLIWLFISISSAMYLIS